MIQGFTQRIFSRHYFLYFSVHVCLWFCWEITESSADFIQLWELVKAVVMPARSVSSVITSNNLHRPQWFASKTSSNPVFPLHRWCVALLAHYSIRYSLNSATIKCSLKWKISIQSMLSNSVERQPAGLCLLFMVVTVVFLFVIETTEQRQIQMFMRINMFIIYNQVKVVS